MDRLHIYIASYLTGAIAVALAVLLRRYWYGDEAEDQDQRLGPGFHFLWMAVIFKLMLIYLVVSLGYVTIWGDDTVRFYMARGMVDNFDLGYEDHIWPGGPFMMYSLFMKLFYNNYIAVRILTGLFSMGSVLMAGVLAWQLTHSRLGAVMAAVALAALPMHTFLSTGAMTEVPLAFFMLSSVVCGLHGWQRLQEDRGGTGPMWLLAGLLATFAASYRYEGWMFIASFGSLAMAHWIWKQWGDRLPEKFAPGEGPRLKHHFAWLLGAGFVAMIFPIAWMISSRSELGSFFGFFNQQVGMNTENMEGTILEKLWFLPHGIFFQNGAIWGWIIFGIACTLILGRKRPIVYFGSLLLLGFCALFILVAAVKGTGVARERYVLSMIAFLVPFIAGTFSAIEYAIRRLAIPVKSAAILAILITGYSIYHYGLEVSYHHRYYPQWGYRHSTYMAGELLRHEFVQAEMLPGIGKFGKVIVWRPEYTQDDHLMHIVQMTGREDRYIHLKEETFPPNIPTENATILLFGETKAPVPERYKLITEMPYLSIYHDSEAFNN